MMFLSLDEGSLLKCRMVGVELAVAESQDSGIAKSRASGFEAPC
jgi:hypothetical protein